MLFPGHILAEDGRHAAPRSTYARVDEHTLVGERYCTATVL